MVFFTILSNWGIKSQLRMVRNTGPRSCASRLQNCAPKVNMIKNTEMQTPLLLMVKDKKFATHNAPTNSGRHSTTLWKKIGSATCKTIWSPGPIKISVLRISTASKTMRLMTATINSAMSLPKNRLVLEMPNATVFFIVWFLYSSENTASTMRIVI